MYRVMGMGLLLTSMATFALAGVVSAPEIDASSAVAGIGLLSGAVLILRSRRKKS